MRVLKTFPLVLLAFAVLALAGEEVSDARAIAGTVKKIGVSMRAVTADATGNIVSADHPELSLVLSGADDVVTMLRWDTETTIRNHKGLGCRSCLWLHSRRNPAPGFRRALPASRMRKP